MKQEQQQLTMEFPSVANTGMSVYIEMYVCMLLFSKGGNFAYHQEGKQTATTTITKAVTKVAGGSRQLRLICLAIANAPRTDKPTGCRTAQRDRRTNKWIGKQTDR